VKNSLFSIETTVEGDNANKNNAGIVPKETLNKLLQNERNVMVQGVA
jgi:hypothetical protein